MRKFVRQAVAATLFAALLFARVAVAQEAPPTDPATGLTADKVQQRLKRIEETSELDKDLKPKIVDLYKRTLAELAGADDWNKKAVYWQSRRQQDPEELVKTKARIEQGAGEPELPDEPDTVTLTQLEQKLADAETDLKARQRHLAEAETEPKRRRAELPQLVATAQQRLKDVDQELATLPAATDSLDLPEARRVLLTAVKRSVQAELAAYDNERLCYEVNSELVAAEQELAAQDAHHAETRAKHYRELVNERRKQDAVKQAEEARRAAVVAMPELKVLADRNAELTQQQNGPNGFPAKITAMTNEAEQLRKDLADIRARFERIKARIDAGGMTDAIGMLLQKQQADLPDLRKHRLRLRELSAETAQVKAKVIELEEQKVELVDIEKQVRKVMDGVDPHMLPYERDEIETELRGLLKARLGYLESQINDGDAYSWLEIDLGLIERDLISEIDAYQQFINERILWVRSTAPLGLSDLQRGWAGLVRMADVRYWLTVARELTSDVSDNSPLYILLAVVLIPLIALQRRLRKRIHAIDQQTAQSYAADIRPTIEVAVLTALVAMLWPGLIALLGWRMSVPAAASMHSQNIAYGLRMTALVYISLELVRQICRKRGLAESHFGWPIEGVALVRRHLRWSMWLGLPLSFVVSVVEAPEFEVHRSPLGRLAFIGGLTVLAVFSHFVLHPRRGMVQALRERKEISWFWQQPRLWHLLSVGGAVALAVVAATGYFYTALQLAWRLHATIWLLLGLLIAQAFAQRCLLVARRKLAIKQARERRAAAQLHAHSVAGEPVAGTASRPVDLVTIDVQTRRLLRSFINVALVAGCWLIWIDVLPALGILDRCQLWQTVARESLNPADGQAAVRFEWITLGDVVLCGVIVLMTFVAGRNLPGLLEIAFLQRLPMDPGGRYAITTMSRYLITLVGVAVAFWMIGIGWSNVQWLVAAMTVGLGFGLQEIFANFVSGLIILFERPVRVGDTVTIGGVSGVVSRIRIRATTITDWDRKELIVPNKEFITGQLINWTLSDSILRMVIKLGVAYGSDVNVARGLLLQAAHEDHRVLRDPAPSAAFEAFGASTLDFELRVFVAGLDVFGDVRHDLNTRIDHLFREAGIELAFPQCDVHLRSVDGGADILPRVAESLKRAS